MPDDANELLKLLNYLEKKLNAIEKIHTIGIVTDSVGHVAKRKKNGYYLLILDIEKGKITVRTFDGVEKGLDEATAAYNDFEKNKGDKKQDAVLVSAESYETLVDAYPNYFANIHEFAIAYYNIQTKLYKQLNDDLENKIKENQQTFAEML